MAPALLSYTLPMQLVCNLVTTGNSSIGGTIPELLSTIQQFSPTESSRNDEIPLSTFNFSSPTPAQALPPGYVPHPEIGVAYKVYDDSVTWYVASARCAQDRAQLANIDSFTKIEVVNEQQPVESNSLHVGFFFGYGNDRRWYSVKTGLPVSNIPWNSGRPLGSLECARIIPGEVGLYDYTCLDERGFVCELPYP